MEVRLIDYTRNPLQVMASVKGLIQGKHVIPEKISYEEAKEEFEDSLRSGIYGVFEFVSFSFDLMGVSRAFTHQLVRTRSAAFMQESMRFSAKIGEQFKYLPINWKDNSSYDECMVNIHNAYDKLIEEGCPIEEARGVLPTNILTSICFVIDYRNLIHMMEQRMCFQTQGEHREVALEIKKEVSKIEPLMGEYLQASCFHNGWCSWESKLDRKCKMHSKFPLRSEYLKSIGL